MTTRRHAHGQRPPGRSPLWRSTEQPIRCSLPSAWPPHRQARAASKQHLSMTSLVRRDTFNRLIAPGLVPAGEYTKKEVNTMQKRTIIKWWVWGLIIQVAGVI